MAPYLAESRQASNFVADNSTDIAADNSTDIAAGSPVDIVAGNPVAPMVAPDQSRMIDRMAAGKNL